MQKVWVHAKDSLLSLARAISEAVGSAILTHVSLSELGSRGTSDFLLTLKLPTSIYDTCGGCNAQAWNGPGDHGSVVQGAC